MNTKQVLLFLIVISHFSIANAGENETLAYFNTIKDEPTLLRNFLFRFPKGGDLHNHLDGAIYAENYIKWAAHDGKCIDLKSSIVLPPPCNAEVGKPAVKDIQTNSGLINPIIDALSVRNYERRSVSGHDQFFSTFRRFFEAGIGHEGHMLAEVSARAARQNIVYLELMQSWGMAEARSIAVENGNINLQRSIRDLAGDPALSDLADSIILKLNDIEEQWKAQLRCGSTTADPGCHVPVRYLAQVIRVFPRDQVLAQTILAYMLISKDPRYVGLNFVAPEDHPVALRDYAWHMEIIAELGKQFPQAKRGITLHAGEVAMGLVPPEDLGWHIRDAIETAGARRIGHGIDIFYDSRSEELMRYMKDKGIMVEINLTSNDVILEVKDKQHPFNAYKKYKVPMAFSTDDEGVSRIDLTHEYQRAVETFDLSYREMKEFSRNALRYSFLTGESLFRSHSSNEIVTVCSKANPAARIPRKCKRFLDENDKARWQWDLEQRFSQFEEEFH